MRAKIAEETDTRSPFQQKNAPSAFLEYGADGDGGVAKHTSFIPLRLSAESSSRPLPLFGAAWRPHLLYPLCEVGGGVEDTLNVI